VRFFKVLKLLINMNRGKKFVLIQLFLAMLILLFLIFLIKFFAKQNNFDLQDTEICYACALSKSDSERINKLKQYYSNFSNNDFYLTAEKMYIYGRLTKNKTLVCESIKYYEKVVNEYDSLFLYESLFMLSQECNLNKTFYLEKIISLSDNWKRDFYRSLKQDNFSPKFRINEINKEVYTSRNVTKVIFGSSYIKINNSIIGTQVDRVNRDWFAFNMNLFSGEVDNKKIWKSHEGARINDILKYSDSKIIPLTGTIAIKKDNQWLASDEKGVFRFEVSFDKIQYPSTKCYKNICLLVDTHGISALVSQAVENDVDLVIGCGDHPGKMQAAYHLAMEGIDVYFPADRFISQVLFHDAKGTLIGTAPVKDDVIGNQTIEIDIRELIVVQDFIGEPPGHYYDAPARYFRELEKYVNLNTEYYDSKYETSEVMEYAIEKNVKIVAVRVITNNDYISVKNWLKKDSRNRAILFHTSLYDYSQPLFLEFPNQTSFGDPKPKFV